MCLGLPSQNKIPGRADRGRHGWGPEEGELATACWVCIAAFAHSPERPLPTPPTPPTPLTCCPPQDVYSLSKCVVPLPATIMRRIGVPLPAELVQMEEQGVGWEEFQVRQSSQLLRTGWWQHQHLSTSTLWELGGWVAGWRKVAGHQEGVSFSGGYPSIAL